MILRLLLDGWNGRRKGTILTCVPDGQANLMVTRGIAEVVTTAEGAADSGGSAAAPSLTRQAENASLQRHQDRIGRRARRHG